MLPSNKIEGSVYIYIYVAIHALASMPSAPRLSEADSKTSTEVPCLYALRMPQAFCKNIAIALDTSACLSFHKSQETNGLSDGGLISVHDREEAGW
jgi:hypothetical protein